MSTLCWALEPECRIFTAGPSSNQKPEKVGTPASVQQSYVHIPDFPNLPSVYVGLGAPFKIGNADHSPCVSRPSGFRTSLAPPATGRRSARAAWSAPASLTTALARTYPKSIPNKNVCKYKYKSAANHPPHPWTPWTPAPPSPHPSFF